MSEIKLCKDCKHFKAPTPFIKMQMQNAAYSNGVGLLPNKSVNPTFEPECGRPGIWETNLIYGHQQPISSDGAKAEWQRKTDCGKDAKFFEQSIEPELPVYENHVLTNNGGLFGGSFGSVTATDEPVRPWWKFWGKA